MLVRDDSPGDDPAAALGDEPRQPGPASPGGVLGALGLGGGHGQDFTKAAIAAATTTSAAATRIRRRLQPWLNSLRLRLRQGVRQCGMDHPGWAGRNTGLGARQGANSTDWSAAAAGATGAAALL